MTKEEMLKRIEKALRNAGFDDAAISDDGEAVFVNDEDGNPWAITPEQF